MTETATRLNRTDDGGYVTRDGRWTVTPVVMGAGTSNGRRWSNGRREWSLTDTTGRATLSRHGKSSVVVDALWRARDIIAHHERQEA